ncbi:acetyl-coenzyme A synthetase, partial [Pisolithus croceorrhizus]
SLLKELVLQVRKVIEPFAAPKKVIIVPDLPKTRSSKIMRRIMRKIVAGEGDQLGDLSTIAEPSVVEVIKKKVAESL